MRDAVEAWRSGTRRSQTLVLLALLNGVGISFAVSWFTDLGVFPFAGFFFWMVLGMLLLRFEPMAVLIGIVALTGSVSRIHVGGRGTVAGVVAILAASALVLYAASRQRSGLPSPLSSALLADLRDRLNAQGRVPPLPEGWHAETAMIAAYGVGYAGDFMVVDLDEEEQRLDLVLVDVVGKGVAAAPSSLLFAGALGGMVGTLPGRQLLDSANDYLLRQQGDDAFATAVHLSVDLASGRFTVLSAGHPPALRWNGASRDWTVDASQGLALGVLPHPEIEASEGLLLPGDALLFYTDGVVEARGEHIDDGISWLQGAATTAIDAGLPGSAARIIRGVPRGDDDRAVLLLGRL